MGFHRSSAMLLCLLCAGLVSVNIGGCRGDLPPAVTATFGGGYYGLSLPSPRGEHLSASLAFNSSRSPETLLVALGQDNASYVAIGLDVRGMLVSFVGGSTFAPNCSSAQRCEVRVEVNSTTLVVAVDDGDPVNLTIQPVTFASVYVGGVPSFLTPPFSLLPFASSFIGCISDATVNNVSLTFAPAYGVQVGCCPSPNHVSQTFYGHASSLKVPLPADVSICSPFKLSMDVLVEGDGVLVSSATGNSSLLMELVGGVAFVHLRTWGDVASVNLSCGSVLSDGSWHTLTLALSPSLAVCTVDALSNSAVLTTAYCLGSELRFGAQRNPLANPRDGFNGSIRHLRLNDRDVAGGDTADPCPDGPFVSGTCPCPLFDYDVWDTVSVVTKAAGVDQGGGVLIDSNVLTLTLPLDHSVEGDALSTLYYNAIVFSVTAPPSYGSIRSGPTSPSSSKVATFTYSDFASGSIFYQQEGSSLGARDTAGLEASVVCSGRTKRLAVMTLSFAIRRRPYSTSLHDLPVVVGTKTLITNYTIAFADFGTPPSELKYTVVLVSAYSGGNGGTIENIYGAAQVYFTQADIDAGLIVFNHNELAGTQPVVVELRVSDAGGGQPVTKQVAVLPYLPLFNVTSGRTLGLIARTSVPLGLTSLLTGTNCGNQFPTIVYVVTVPPRQGYVAVKSAGDQWANASRFTQAQVNDGSVQFVHTGLAGADSFKYKIFGFSDVLPESSLAGPEGELALSVVQVKNVTLRASVVTVDEGKGVVIDSRLVDVEVDGGDASLAEEVVLLSVLGPFHGSLSLTGLAVTNGSFSLRQMRAGQLVYVHDGSEAHEDSFQLTLRAKLGLSYNYTTRAVSVPVVITPVDNHAPVLTQRAPIDPTEGLWIAVTPDMLSAADQDLPETDLGVTVFVNGSGGFGGHFVYRREMQMVGSLQPIANFTMSDVSSGYIIFVHRFGSALNGVVAVTVTDAGGLQCTGNILVAARPLNITASPVTLQGLPCIAQVSATSTYPVFNMNQSMVRLDLNDIGRKPSIMVFVARGPVHGTLQWNATMINFTVATNWIYWDHINTMRYTLDPRAANTSTVTKDSFSLEFVLGHGSSQSVRFEVCIHPIPIPSMSYNGSLMVTQGGVGFLNGSILVGTDTDQSPNNKLVYQIQTQPMNGYIYQTNASGDQVTNFTQDQVFANQIAYKHVLNQTLGDSFTVVLSNGYAQTAPYKVTINIIVTSLIVINKGFSCIEGQSHIITTDELNVIAPAGYGVVLYLLGTDFIKAQPFHGHLDLLTGTSKSPLVSPLVFTLADLALGRVQYTHDGAEVKTDSFQFGVTAVAAVAGGATLGTMTTMDVVNINIILVNDNPPTLLNHTAELSVVWGAILRFDSSMLSAYDPDVNVPITNLQYIVTIPLICGEMRLTYQSDPVMTFLEGDIRNGSLYYMHTKSCLYDYLVFFVTDGIHRLPSTELTKINIKEAIFTPLGSMTITVPKRESGIITTSSLNYTVNSPSQAKVSFRYEVKTRPQFGDLLLLTEPAITFTQSDVDSNKLSYHHNGNSTPEDSFRFTVTVVSQGVVSGVQDFKIKVQPVDDEPPIMTMLQRPLYAIEGSIVEFTWHSLCAYASFYSPGITDCSQSLASFDNLHYLVVRAPLYGCIELSRFRASPYANTTTFSQLDININSVRYNSTTMGHYNDSFVFKISTTKNVQPVTYQEDIVLLPQVLPLNVTGFTIYEGGSANITSHNIMVLHPYLCNIIGKLSIQTPPRHGTLRILQATTPTGDPLNFTSSNLQEGTIVYVHDDSDTTYDQFQFLYTVQVDGHRIVNNLTTFPIQIIPVNDEPPVLEPSTVHLNVWVGETVVLGVEVLDASDADTNNTYLTYNVTASSGGVVLVKASNRSVPVFSFLQQEVVDRKLLLVHQSGHNGSLSLSLMDGVAVVYGTINWVATELVLSLVNNRILTVPMGSRVPLTRANLLVVSNEIQPQGVVVYYVMEVSYGVILRDMNPAAVVEFNQTEVDTGRITYLHTRLDYWEASDVVKLRAGTRITAKQALPVSLPIRIQLPQAGGGSPLAACGTLYVLKGGQLCLNESFLDARNLRYGVWKTLPATAYPSPSDLTLTYVITARAQHGAVLVGNASAGQFSHDQLSKGLVCYQQNGSYAPNDLFRFSVVVGQQPLPYGLQMTIVIVPTHLTPPSLVVAIQMVFLQGFSAVITNGNLWLTDVDTPPEELVYYTTALPSNGELSASGTANPTNFTQASIDSGLLVFRPYTIGNSTFTFNFTNGVRWGHGNLTLSVVAHTLTAAPVQYLVYTQSAQSGVVRLDAATNGNRSETIYKVAQPPRGGYIAVANARSSDFSQQDVDMGKVRYVPTDTSAYSDVFALNVTNRNKRVANVSVVVTVAIFGQARSDLHLDMGGYLSQNLPANTFDLEALQKKASIPPTIYILRPPSFGYLTMSYLHSYTRRALGAQGGSMFTFRYDDLQNGWVNYTWAPRQYVNSSHCVNESFTALVEARGFQVGVVDVQFTVQPPPKGSWEATSAISQPSTVTSSVGILHNVFASSTSNPEQFPVYALVPIGGVIMLVPLIVGTVALLYCIQQKNLRMKFRRVNEAHNSASPWGGQYPQAPQLPNHMAHYHDGISVESEEGEEGEEERGSEHGGSRLGGGSQRTYSAGGRPHSSSSQGYLPRRHGSNVTVNISQHFLSERNLERPAISPSPAGGSLRSSSRSPTKYLPNEPVAATRNTSADSGFQSATVGVGQSGSRCTVRGGSSSNSPDVKELLCATTSVPILKKEEYWV